MCQGLGPNKHDEISEIDRRLRELTASARSAGAGRGPGQCGHGRSYAISIYIYIYIYVYIYIYIYIYTRSPLEDPRLFGPSPRKILAATNEKDISDQPSPWRKSS